MSTNMRGLTQYISDLRACRVRDLEEKRINREMAHIRQKFKEGNLDGYQKKKYLAKVVFTYILGYKVDVGHMEAVNLISSQKYSEKQIGYLALTLLMNEGSDMVRLVINSIGKDLEDHNEINCCLALHAIANLGGKEMAEALSDGVFRAMVSAASTTFVKKKAALTLLRLYRKHPSVVPVDDWAERIVDMIEDRDPGVAMTAVTLVTTMAQDNLDAFQGCYKIVVEKLDSLIFDGNYPSEYVYYKVGNQRKVVPNPWLQIKILRLLQYYPPPDNAQVIDTLHSIIQAIIDMSQDTPRNVQHNNAQNAVLFEAINLAIHLDPDSKVVSNASILLGRFILAKETNVRYLGLDAMAHLAACSNTLEPIKKHQETIILSLKDRDISVRRRALDLLYSMCDTSNSKVIVGELVKYLQSADYNLREEMVLKIAILTERFATEYEWYVDTILKLISAAGDHVGAEVWYRVVQLVTNNEDLQPYAAAAVFHHLKTSACHENMIKVGGYILGEFGHLIANEPGSSPIEQFQALHSKVNQCTAPTRALLLTTYVKWVNLFPEIKEHLINIFERYTHVLDAELQQRACEYLALARREDGDELLANICDEMPVFPERESALVSRLHKKGSGTQDKRTWVIGGRDENQERTQERFREFRKGTGDSTTIGAASRAIASEPKSQSQSIARPASPPAPAPPVAEPTRQASLGADEMMGTTSRGPADDIMSSLAGLDMTGNNVQAEPLLPDSTANGSTPGIGDDDGRATLGGVDPFLLRPLTVGPNIDKWYERLTYANEGVLYEDDQIQIGIKAEYHSNLGRIALFIGNKVSTEIKDVKFHLEHTDPESLHIRFHDPPVGEIQGRAQIQELVHVDCRAFFKDPPVLRMSFLAGGKATNLVLRLPVVLSRFVEGVTLEQAPFFERWKIIGGAPREAQKIFPIRLTSSDEVDITRNTKIVAGNRVTVLPNVDPSPTNIVMAGVLHMSKQGKVGILGRLEPNKDAKLCRLTIRSTNENVSKEFLHLLSQPLNADVAAS